MRRCSGGLPNGAAWAHVRGLAQQRHVGRTYGLARRDHDRRLSGARFPSQVGHRVAGLADDCGVERVERGCAWMGAAVDGAASAKREGRSRSRAAASVRSWWRRMKRGDCAARVAVGEVLARLSVVGAHLVLKLDNNRA